MTTTPTAEGVDSISQSQPGYDGERAASAGAEPAAAKCGTCRHMGRIYHDGGFEPDHSCGKSDERRRDAHAPTGDASFDFERAWRTFFDATPGQAACRCYEQRPLLDEANLAVLRQFEGSRRTSSSFATFKFLSPECSACERMDKMFVLSDWSPSGPFKAWRTTPLGRAELARANSPPTQPVPAAKSESHNHSEKGT